MRIRLFNNALAAIARTLLVLVTAGLVPGAGAVEPKAPTSGKAAKDDFMPYVELAPFVVNGQRLAISIHARSKGDRRYAEEFAEGVVKVVYEGVTESTGKGLVIIGKKGEPHPVFVFRKFLKLAEEGKLDPAVAARGPELFKLLDHWQSSVREGEDAEGGGQDEVDLEFDKIVTALPLPLEGVGAKLYQLAWTEGFDEAKVEAKLRALRPADLEGNMFARFDWVFYLPPKGAFDQVLDSLIAEALKEEEAGFFTRTIVKGALLAVKPMIRRAIEGMRRGVLFSTVVQARTDLSPEGVSELTGAYVNVLMPDHRAKGADASGSEHDRAVRAVRAEFRSLKEKPRPAEEPKSGEESPPVEAPVAEPAAENK